MNDLFYEMIFKRKSFHLFKNFDEKISTDTLNEIYDMFYKLTPLMKNIKVDMKIVPANKTTCNRGQEYCILLYSETKDNYLQNIGYIGEQLDLYLASRGIGALWFGIGKTEQTKLGGLDFVIMIAIAKSPEIKFRKDMFKSKRKPLEEIFCGLKYQDVFNIIRFAPSACNTQPWKVKVYENYIDVYRYKKEGKRGIMPVNKVDYYNQIDIGIFLLFTDVCLQKNNISFKKSIYIDDCSSEKAEILNARYFLNEEKTNASLKI